MNQLTKNQIKLLKSRHVSRSSFYVNGVVFDCLEGEWLVSSRGHHVDVFTFSRMSDSEFKETVHNIFNNVKAITL